MRTLRVDELDEDFFVYHEASELSSVKGIIDDVRQRGDQAVLEYTRRFDGADISRIPVEHAELQTAYDRVEANTIDALKRAAENIQRFCEIQKKQFKDFTVELQPGVFTGQRVIPIHRVGVYVPGGRYPLVSTLLMCAVPAKVAGVEELAVCSPPSLDGSIHPVILAAAGIVGIEEIYKIGGVQAIAALAYGTESVKAADKIVGPGNKYVTQAKKEVFGKVGIDLIAGPTEVLIIADESANAEILAADLLAQAEHDEDAKPILVTTSRYLVREVNNQVRRQLEHLNTAETARTSVERNGLIILVENLDEAVTLANRKAPEHLQLQIDDPARIIPRLTNYGSLFAGKLAAEVLGDYSSGINHTLPTNTTARYRGGLGVLDFLKFQTILNVTAEGFDSIGPVAQTLANAEGLDGHGKSIEIRMTNK
ncbi:MAG: histidinol dehydrogenase [bacterium]